MPPSRPKTRCATHGRGMKTGTAPEVEEVEEEEEEEEGEEGEGAREGR